MARRYVRDARGRFAPKGYSGQTGGRGARLKSGKGNIREVGGQKRGERHVLRSSESKAAGRAATAAAVKSGGIIVSRKYGGQGKSRDSAEFKAAQAAKRVAQAKRDAAERKSGLPKSGGAMRVKGGIKRDPQAGEKLKQLQQKNKPQSVDSLNAARQKANADLDQKRAAYFGTKYGTPEQKKARADLLAAEKKSNAATNAWRDAKAGIKPDTPKSSYAATKIEQAKGRVKQFTTAKKSVDAEIRQVRQQIKDARSNAMTFGDVPALKLKLLSLKGKSQEYKATIDRAKRQAKGE